MQKENTGSSRDLSPANLIRQLGRRIAQFRRARNWTRRELASRLNVSSKTLANWEQGLCQPSFPALVALADHLQVTMDQMASGE